MKKNKSASQKGDETFNKDQTLYIMITCLECKPSF